MKSKPPTGARAEKLRRDRESIGAIGKQLQSAAKVLGSFEMIGDTSEILLDVAAERCIQAVGLLKLLLIHLTPPERT